MKNSIFIFVFIGIALPGLNKAAAQNGYANEKSHNNNTQSNSQNIGKKEIMKDSLVVSGLCESCKNRIEKAAKKIKGVSYAQWNEITHILIYTYTGMVKKEDVSNSILKAGHDTELGKAPDKIYNALPACCKYRKEK